MYAYDFIDIVAPSFFYTLLLAKDKIYVGKFKIIYRVKHTTIAIILLY